MKNNWEIIGLIISVASELLFWVLYLSTMLVEIGSPYADILWLLSGALGIIFGIICQIGFKSKTVTALSLISLILGVIQIPLWALALLVTSM